MERGIMGLSLRGVLGEKIRGDYIIELPEGALT
jgi:hypothetical protein